ncbi:hypothetical protein ACFQU9_34735 [Actinomadura namibiensis]|uniref:hypothetical protein n=1 Tax=Actinomadura kijaniata TaxID=46161 RepID=UPI00360B2A02
MSPSRSNARSRARCDGARDSVTAWNAVPPPARKRAHASDQAAGPSGSSRAQAAASRSARAPPSRNQSPRSSAQAISARTADGAASSQSRTASAGPPEPPDIMIPTATSRPSP